LTAISKLEGVIFLRSKNHRHVPSVHPCFAEDCAILWGFGKLYGLFQDGFVATPRSLIFFPAFLQV